MPRRPREGATLYPVACSPQAWSVAAVFLLLQASLGIDVDAGAGEVRVDQPDFSLGLTDDQKRDLVAYLKSL